MSSTTSVQENVEAFWKNLLQSYLTREFTSEHVKRIHEDNSNIFLELVTWVKDDEQLEDMNPDMFNNMISKMLERYGAVDKSVTAEMGATYAKSIVDKLKTLLVQHMEWTKRDQTFKKMLNDFARSKKYSDADTLRRNITVRLAKAVQSNVLEILKSRIPKFASEIMTMFYVLMRGLKKKFDLLTGVNYIDDHSKMRAVFERSINSKSGGFTGGLELIQISRKLFVACAQIVRQCVEIFDGLSGDVLKLCLLGIGDRAAQHSSTLTKLLNELQNLVKEFESIIDKPSDWKSIESPRGKTVAHAIAYAVIVFQTYILPSPFVFIMYPGIEDCLLFTPNPIIGAGFTDQFKITVEEVLLKHADVDSLMTEVATFSRDDEGEMYVFLMGYPFSWNQFKIIFDRIDEETQKDDIIAEVHAQLRKDIESNIAKRPKFWERIKMQSRLQNNPESLKQLSIFGQHDPTQSCFMNCGKAEESVLSNPQRTEIENYQNDVGRNSVCQTICGSKRDKSIKWDFKEPFSGEDICRWHEMKDRFRTTQDFQALLSDPQGKKGRSVDNHGQRCAENLCKYRLQTLLGGFAKSDIHKAVRACSFKEADTDKNKFWVWMNAMPSKSKREVAEDLLKYRYRYDNSCHALFLEQCPLSFGMKWKLSTDIEPEKLVVLTPDQNQIVKSLNKILEQSKTRFSRSRRSGENFVPPPFLTITPDIWEKSGLKSEALKLTAKSCMSWSHDSSEFFYYVPVFLQDCVDEIKQKIYDVDGDLCKADVSGQVSTVCELLTRFHNHEKGNPLKNDKYKELFSRFGCSAPGTKMVATSRIGDIKSLAKKWTTWVVSGDSVQKEFTEKNIRQVVDTFLQLVKTRFNEEVQGYLVSFYDVINKAFDYGGVRDILAKVLQNYNSFKYNPEEIDGLEFMELLLNNASVDENLLDRTVTMIYSQDPNKFIKRMMVQIKKWDEMSLLISRFTKLQYSIYEEKLPADKKIKNIVLKEMIVQAFTFCQYGKNVFYNPSQNITIQYTDDLANFIFQFVNIVAYHRTEDSINDIKFFNIPLNIQSTIFADLSKHYVCALTRGDDTRCGSRTKPDIFDNCVRVFVICNCAFIVKSFKDMMTAIKDDSTYSYLVGKLDKERKEESIDIENSSTWISSTGNIAEQHHFQIAQYLVGAALYKYEYTTGEYDYKPNSGAEFNDKMLRVIDFSRRRMQTSEPGSAVQMIRAFANLLYCVNSQMNALEKQEDRNTFVNDLNKDPVDLGWREHVNPNIKVDVYSNLSGDKSEVAAIKGPKDKNKILIEQLFQQCLGTPGKTEAQCRGESSYELESQLGLKSGLGLGLTGLGSAYAAYTAGVGAYGFSTLGPLAAASSLATAGSVATAMAIPVLGVGAAGAATYALVKGVGGTWFKRKLASIPETAAEYASKKIPGANFGGVLENYARNSRDRYLNKVQIVAEDVVPVFTAVQINFDLLDHLKINKCSEYACAFNLAGNLSRYVFATSSEPTVANVNEWLDMFRNPPQTMLEAEPLPSD